VVARQLLGHKSADVLGSPEFPGNVVDERIVGEGFHDGIHVEAVDRGDVRGDHRIQRQLYGHCVLLDRCWRRIAVNDDRALSPHGRVKHP
jgi:hypothetical protein